MVWCFEISVIFFSLFLNPFLLSVYDAVAFRGKTYHDIISRHLLVFIFDFSLSLPHTRVSAHTHRTQSCPTEAAIVNPEHSMAIR